MRLTKFESEKIKKCAQETFGNDVVVKLFGSRIYDDKKGGDIDLLIHSNNQDALTIENKIQFLVRLKSEIGDQKIDVVLGKYPEKSIVKEAQDTGIII